MQSSKVPTYDRELDRVRWLENLPFWGVHVAAIVGVAMLGFSWSGLGLALIFYYARMFGITGGYHRYFSHRAYKTSRPVQFLLGLLGVFATQKGPLWWASHHRRHHKYSDQPEDIHSPRQRGFLWSHMLWILVKRHKTADFSNIKDLTQYPELRFLDKYENLIVIAFATAIGVIGGAWALVWGYFVSTTLLWHGTFFINSLAHIWGRRRYQTTDDSKNSFLLAIVCMGEGWHNNHHYYQRSANQGFFWWEIDLSYYIIRAWAAVGLVWDVRVVPRHVRAKSVAPGRARLSDDAG
ncbi:MAG: acyl-CoA desaturase, partial [Myxococcales bacterium]|nr:acyl-CoA desaturase [Myxococcales bacterium]